MEFSHVTLGTNPENEIRRDVVKFVAESAAQALADFRRNKRDPVLTALQALCGPRGLLSRKEQALVAMTFFGIARLVQVSPMMMPDIGEVVAPTTGGLQFLEQPSEEWKDAALRYVAAAAERTLELYNSN